MILCIGTTPAAQRVMVFPRLVLDEVNRATRTLDGAAGKSINVAKVLQALGETPFAVSVLGGPRGEQLAACLRQRQIQHEFIPAENPTRECVTVIDQQAGTVTELVEESPPVSPLEAEALIGLVQRCAAGARALVMSGTIARGMPAEFYAHGTRLAHQQSALAIVDAQGSALSLSLAAQPDLVKPNRNELAATVGRPLPDETAILAAARELQQRGAARVVVTAGRHPTLACDGSNAWRITSPFVQAVNPIGSGDAFTAALTAGLLRGYDLGEACRWGAAAGTANAVTLMAGELEPAYFHQLLPQVRVERL